jgi:GTP-binding protein HflX
VERVAVGDARKVAVPRQPSAPAGRDRFCTLRFLSTRLTDEPLTAGELAPLALHRLDAMAVVAVEPDGMPGPVRVAHLLPADEGRSERAQEPSEESAHRLPPGAITAPPRRRQKRTRQDAEDVTADGERYRVFAPRPASQVDDDFLALIGALEEEFARRRERTRVAGKAGRAILVHVTTGPPPTCTWWTASCSDGRPSTPAR